MVKLIKNIRVVDPANDVDGIFDIHIENGKIAGYTKSGAGSDEDRNIKDDEYGVIDGSGLIAAPGLTDIHVHFRDPGQTYKEDIHTGALSAAAGGYTSVVMMANTVPTIDCPEVLNDVIKRASQEAIHIYSSVNATIGMKGEKLPDYNRLIADGAVGITDDGKPILDADLFEMICEKAARLDVPLSLHEEDPKYISENGVNAGSAAESIGLKGSDRQAEISLIDRDLKIASKTKVKLNIQHISTREGVELVRRAKKNNPNIHAEATPHHFSLTDEAVKEYGTLAKMNPPLRKEEDLKAIREGLKDGTIDIIATDHAPHSAEEKSRDFKNAPSGIIGLETALSLAVTNLVDNGVISLSQLIRLMSLNPARLYGLDAGTLSVGAKADIVIFSPDEEYTVKRFYSKSFNSPFIGMKLKGRVRYTICEGNIVYDLKKSENE